MCPFCIGAAAAWIAAGVVSTGGVSAMVAAKFWNSKARARAEGADDDQQ